MNNILLKKEFESVYCTLSAIFKKQSDSSKFLTLFLDAIVNYDKYYGY